MPVSRDQAASLFRAITIMLVAALLGVIGFMIYESQVRQTQSNEQRQLLCKVPELTHSEYCAVIRSRIKPLDK